MSRRTSATVAPAPHNPAPPVREEAEDREAAPHSPAWGLYVAIAFIILSLGGGGIATLLSLLGVQLPAGTQYAVIVLTSLSAVALSGFITKGLGEIKVGGAELLDKIGPVGSPPRNEAEVAFGSGTHAYRLAQAGQASAILAVASNGAMLATALARTKTDDAELLPLGWLIANALLTSGSNLAGFVLFTILGARNGWLLAKVHKDELEAEKRKISTLQDELAPRDRRIADLANRISTLEARLRETGLAVLPDEGESSTAVTTDLFRRRPSAVVASADTVQRLTGASALTEAAVGAAAIPAAPVTGYS